MQSGPRRPRAKRRGFILIAALALMFVMVLFALILANLGRSMHGFTMITQGEASEYEATLFTFAELRGILQGDLSSATLGLPASLGPSGSLSGSTNSNDATFSGKLTYQKPNGPSGPESYASTVAATGWSGVVVPTCHAAAMVKSTIPGAPDLASASYLCMYTSNYPYGLLAPNGGIQVHSVRSTSDLDGADGHLTGLMANLFAAHDITVGGTLNGRAYSSGNGISVASNGIVYRNWPNPVAIPTDFSDGLNSFKTSAVSGLGNSLMTALQDLHGALHEDFGPDLAAATGAEETAGLAQGGQTTVFDLDPYNGHSTTQNVVNSPGDTDYSGGTLTVGVSLRIPGENDELNFSTVNISGGDLVLEDNSVLHVHGDLTVSGAIRMGKKATLIVDGATRATELSMKYQAPADNVGISSAVWGKGNITLTSGMSQTDVLWTPNIPGLPSNPYNSTLYFTVTVPNEPAYETPGSCNNPIYDDFQARQVADAAKLAADGIQNYLVNVTPTGSSSSVPGVLMMCDGAINLGAGSKASGLFYAAGGIQGTTAELVGAVFAAGGDIRLSGTDFRYFPYFTHAFGHTAGGDLTVAAIHHHPIAFGKLP